MIWVLFFAFLYSLIDLTSSCTNIVAPDGTSYNLEEIPVVSGTDPTDSQRWLFTVSLCNPLPIQCDACGMNSGYCQQSNNKQFAFCVGELDMVTFEGLAGGKGVVATFKSPMGTDGNVRQGVVTVTCKPDAAEPQNIVVHNPPNVLGYNTQFDTAHACGGAHVLSGGTVFLIIFFGGIALYFLAGVIYLGPVKGMRGKEMIPNLNFWVMVPGLIQDGATFTITKIKGLGSK